MAMRPHLPDERRERIASFLAHQRTGVISTAGSPGVWAIPVWYRLNPRSSAGRSLEVDCLVPRWADVAHQLTQNASIVLIVQASSGAGLRWLQVQGKARPVEAPDWSGLLPRWVSVVQPDALYLVVKVTPSRIDLIDEDLGWGVQETLEW
ncbi:MAG: pyridoxamine 5'-phosphate oxidase family protein [Anaerolineales bacterium]|jgi:nitroimidazol reductase NimA-like FMN-containing flavoprotein (pyridoxamine 5'-phosphate oxidase superfamily)